MEFTEARFSSSGEEVVGLPGAGGAAAGGEATAETAPTEASATAEASATTSAYEDGRADNFGNRVGNGVGVAAVFALVFALTEPLGSSSGLAQNTVGKQSVGTRAADGANGVGRALVDVGDYVGLIALGAEPYVVIN